MNAIVLYVSTVQTRLVRVELSELTVNVVFYWLPAVNMVTSHKAAFKRGTSRKRYKTSTNWEGPQGGGAISRLGRVGVAELSRNFGRDGPRLLGPSRKFYRKKF